MRRIFGRMIVTAALGFGVAQMVFSTEINQERVEYLKERALVGDMDSQLSLGLAYMKGGPKVPRDYLKAHEWLEKAALQGKSEAQYNLGYMYAAGIGVRQDYAKAIMWLDKAATQGLAVAQNGLGVMYETGRGVHQNKFVAKKWFGKSCDKGNQNGCDWYRELNEAGY